MQLKSSRARSRKIHLSLLAISMLFALAAIPADAAETSATRPNVLWITYEDAGPQLGCYGDKYATTPNIDSFATSACIYLHAWSTAPVCSPARTALLTGMYPSSLGGIHHRSQVQVPPNTPMYPRLLREAGYYCTNNVKTDYNIATPRDLWDESSARAHWRNRTPGKPFFAVFNLTQSHEGQFRARTGTPRHDPARVPLPAYNPDTPEVRLDWARYYDSLTDVDTAVGKLLRELEEASLAEDTIVIIGADNGIGMPRSKRSVQDSGMHVSLLAHIPAKFAQLVPADYKPGGRAGRLVSFVDMAPTFLALTGLKIPPQIQGKPFLASTAPPPQYMFGERGRMDERYDVSRSVTDGQFNYVRNYLPHLPNGQRNAYMFQTPTTRVWHDLFTSGALNQEQSAFWQPKPVEELYDLQTDPWEVHNLADSGGSGQTSGARQQLIRLRDALRTHILQIRDIGFLPESEMLVRAQSRNPYEVAQDKTAYAMEQVLTTAEAASSGIAADIPRVIEALTAPDSGVRWWGVMGLRIRGAAAVEPNLAKLRSCLNDASPAVQTAAAETLALFGKAEDSSGALEELFKLASSAENNGALRLEALNAIDRLGPKADPLKPRLQQMSEGISQAGVRKGRGAGGNLSLVLDSIIQRNNAAAVAAASE